MENLEVVQDCRGKEEERVKKVLSVLRGKNNIKHAQSIEVEVKLGPDHARFVYTVSSLKL